MSEFTRPTIVGNAHTCGIDCVPTADGRHIMYPALPTVDAGRYQWELNRGMTRRQYRASGQDETRACRVWAAERRKRLQDELEDQLAWERANAAFWASGAENRARVAYLKNAWGL